MPKIHKISQEINGRLKIVIVIARAGNNIRNR